MSRQIFRVAGVGFLLGITVTALAAFGWLGGKMESMASDLRPQAPPSPPGQHALLSDSPDPKPTPISQTGPIHPGEILLLEALEIEAPGQWTRQAVRIDEAGNARLPFLPGRVHLANLTLSEAEDVVDKAYVSGQIVSRSAVQLFRLADAGGNFDPKLLLPDHSAPTLHPGKTQ